MAKKRIRILWRRVRTGCPDLWLWLGAEYTSAVRWIWRSISLPSDRGEAASSWEDIWNSQRSATWTGSKSRTWLWWRTWDPGMPAEWINCLWLSSLHLLCFHRFYKSHFHKDRKQIANTMSINCLRPFISSNAFTYPWIYLQNWCPCNDHLFTIYYHHFISDLVCKVQTIEGCEETALEIEFP